MILSGYRYSRERLNVTRTRGDDPGTGLVSDLTLACYPHTRG